MMKNKKLLVRITALVLIAAGLIVIWVLKTQSKPAPTEQKTGVNPEFALEVSSIDLEALKKYKLPMIIDFGSDSCDPCKAMAPALKKINEEMQGYAIVKFVDVWKHTSAANGFPVQLIPTQVFINADGTPYVPSDKIKIEFIKYAAKDTGKHVFTVHQGGLTEEEMRAILADMGVKK